MAMNTLSESFEEQLEKACQELSLKPTKQQQERLLEYLRQLLKWNKTYNLTAIRDPELALVQHVFDSLAIIKPLNNFIQQRDQDKNAVLDVGSGAGLPGVIIATMMPKVIVTCVDTVEKKIAFVRQVSGVLALTNVKAIHQRVELMQDEKFDVVTSRAFATLQDFATLAGERVEKKIAFVRQVSGVLALNNVKAIHQRVELMQDEKFDVVTSRAFATLQDFATLAGERVEKNGILLAMKGKIPHDEIETLEEKTEWRVDGIEALKVPQLSAQRCLVWMKQKGTQ
jgi:16S rRNA (guanine527-N7)-methyltransferase